MNDATTRPDPPARAPGSGPHLDEVVLTATGLEGEERERYLQEIAAEHPELAAATRACLAAAEDLSDTFLEVPAARRLDVSPKAVRETTPAAALPPGKRYRLGEPLGEGGMGRVVRAFDRQLGRSVALKFLARGNPAILRLFLREAQSQARVQHPNVLEIYDSGELAGEPFIAMRCVAGGTLGEVAPSLSMEQTVRLLVQVAEGLHAAHRHGLLHRDVKPSNVLVHRNPDGELVALVTDFGIATELGDTDALTAGSVAGSPPYIAPERLRGSPAAVNRRSDVYSLGVTMYQVLTGELPFTGENTLDLLLQILHQPLPPPRQKLPHLPVELEAIILRCVARDPDQRYASARAVAADLQRYLDGEVVEAYTASLAYRLTRFVLRNKVLAGMAGVALAALLVASVAVAVFALRAQAARQRAELRQGQAEELIRFMVVDLRNKLDSLGRLDVLDEVGAAAMEYFAAVPEDELSEAELLRRSRMLYQIGEVRIKQGHLDAAVAPMAESLALTRRLAELAPNDGERLFELGQSHFWVGYVHWEQGELAAARGPFMSYLEISRRLVEKDPTNLAWQRELSYAHSNLGSLLEAEGNLEGALEQFHATLAIDEKLVVAEPANADARSELAATHNTIGRVLQDLGRLREAGEHLRADLEIRQTLLAADPEDPHLRDLLGTSYNRLGSHLFLLGKDAEASEHFIAARSIFEDLVAHDPANAPWRLKLVWAHLHLGRVAYARGDLSAAGLAWRSARSLTDDPVARDPSFAWRRTQAITLHHLALLAAARGAPAHGAAMAAVEALEELAASHPTDREVHRWLSQSYLLLGSLEGSPAAARASFEKAEASIAAFAGESHDGRLLAPWAVALRCLGRFDEARSVAATLAAQGYSEPGLAGFCRGEDDGGASHIFHEDVLNSRRFAKVGVGTAQTPGAQRLP